MRNLTFTEPYNRIFVDYKSAIPLILLILVAGTMLPAATVMRYKPKTILTKA